ALDLWDRVRRHYFKGVLARRARKAQAEHRLIVKYLRARDVLALEETIRRHNQNALAAYTSYLDESFDSAQDKRARSVS
ncbi:MAG TPA: hypothetical protein VJ691_03285, partial [Vicinamibacterales bacterium]|nr:hypothetical protein [Vicinamibacterales bacterium]